VPAAGYAIRKGEIPLLVPGGVDLDDPREAPPEQSSFVLRAGESELYGWSAPGGRGLLTSQRCVLLGHPHPIHRVVRWSVDLEGISSLSVQRVRGLPGRRVSMRGSFGAGVISTGSMDPTFGVLVNESRVFVGNPNECEDLQRRIDEARTARCIAARGRLLPYHDAAVDARAPPAASAGAASRAPPTGSIPTGLGAPFVLFITGEPYGASVPSTRHPMTSAVFAGASLGPSESMGGRVPADADPSQIYGPQADMARMVLEIAKKCDVRVKVVDVENLGADAFLVERNISVNDPLPTLIRSDGARLSGAESILPQKVAAFLQGR
jgi:hypothetical protein